ncbi:MAG: hypothetical protein K940chlam2_01824, partial [Chlamydiae bacterium]|nr:hypothetical protein [Chlamydiota bacterium]
LYVGCVGVVFLIRKESGLPRFKTVYFFIALLSFSTLLAMLSQAKPSFAAIFGRWVYSEFYPKGTIFDPSKLRHYLGGVPFHHIYSDIEKFNLRHVLGGIGTMLICATLFISSVILLTNFPLVSWLKKMWQKLREPKDKFQKVKAAVRTPKPLATPFSSLETEAPSPLFEVALKKKRDTYPPPPKAPRGGRLSSYKLPPPELMTKVKVVDHSSLKNDLRRQAEMLEETLLSFGIEAKVGDIHCGPTITSFEVHPAVGVKVQRIRALENDIALNLQAKSIRIIAPIPGKAAVGIEVPNPRPQEVGFRELLENYLRAGKHCHIPLLLGKMVNGEDVWTDLTKMPHLIIAGATGSGKSVCINTVVMSILTSARPDEIKLIMIDPKKVELSGYSKLPHMLTPVITEPGEACAALGWIVKEMEKRYEIFRQLGIRNIYGFNERKVKKELEESLDVDVPENMPYIVVIIDELADLMMVSSSDIETPLARSAQMARAVGIHLILATQRPSREVITGLIKANFPTRIAFKVSSRVNSQIIIDENGAECLLGNGDMLFMPPGTSNLVRTQGAFIRDADINAVIDFVCEQAPTDYLIPSFNAFQQEKMESEGNDPLVKNAKAIVLQTGNASTTFLQRKMKIGYARAASLMDELEDMGIIGPQEGAKARKIFYPTNSKLGK